MTKEIRSSKVERRAGVCSAVWSFGFPLDFVIRHSALHWDHEPTRRRARPRGQTTESRTRTRMTTRTARTRRNALLLLIDHVRHCAARGNKRQDMFGVGCDDIEDIGFVRIE